MNQLVRHHGQMGQGPQVMDQYDIRQIPELKVANIQAVEGLDNNVHLILILEDGKTARIKMDAKSAQGMAMMLTMSSMALDPTLYLSPDEFAKGNRS